MDTVSALSSLSSSLNSQPPSSHFSPVFGGQRGRGSEQGRALQEGSHAGVACSVPLCSLPRQVFKTSPRDVCSNVGKLGRKAPTLPLSAAPQSSPVSLPGPLLPPDPKGAGLGSGNPASRGSRAPPPTVRKRSTYCGYAAASARPRLLGLRAAPDARLVLPPEINARTRCGRKHPALLQPSCSWATSTEGLLQTPLHFPLVMG